MSFPTTSPPPSDARTSVFVDESGRRRARTRFLARTIVACAGIYVLIVIAGLTGSVSLPGAHLGVLRHVASGPARARKLGPASLALPLPPALRPKGSRTPSAPVAAPSPGTTRAAPGPSTGNRAAPATPSTGNQTTTTTAPSSPTTRSPLPTTTTTTKAHGPATSTAHGPPSTKPGLGKGRP